MNKKAVLAALNEVYCRIATTRHGVGLVAIRSIPRGTNPFKNCDTSTDAVRITEAELRTAKAPKAAKMLVRDFCAYQDGVYHVPNYGVDAIDKSYFLNHSTKPNMTTPDGGETFLALRRIKTGEELTADYRSYHTLKYLKLKKPRRKKASGK